MTRVENVKPKGRRTRKWAVGLLIATAVIYAVNGAIIFFAQPTEVQHNSPLSAPVAKGAVELHAYNELRSGGVPALGLVSSVAGYVNMTDSSPVIYLKGDYPEGMRYGQLYKHEIAHVYQKEMVAEASGGYPSVWNPIQSAVYYFNLMRLNGDLRSAMPKTKHGMTSPLTDGLEAAAECFAQPPSNPNEKATFYSANYLADGHCTEAQRRGAIRLIIKDKWFKPLTAAEAAELTPANITSEAPKMDSLNGIGDLSKSFSDLIGRYAKH